MYKAVVLPLNYGGINILMKTVNIVIYKPGYGGHFIEFLLSLDEQTMPLVPLGVLPFHTTADRKKQYSFKKNGRNFIHRISLYLAFFKQVWY